MKILGYGMQLLFSFSSTMKRLKNFPRMHFSRLLFLGVFFVIGGLSPLYAEIFRFNFRDGDTYRINSTVTEDVYLNGQPCYRGSVGCSTGIKRKAFLRASYLYFYDKRAKQQQDVLVGTRISERISPR